MQLATLVIRPLVRFRKVCGTVEVSTITPSSTKKDLTVQQQGPIPTHYFDRFLRTR